MLLMVNFEIVLINRKIYDNNENNRKAVLKDGRLLKEIAVSAFINSRFHKEDFMSALASEYHKLWIENCLRCDQADVVFVYEDSVIKGFNALSYNKKTKIATIVLIGVSRDRQRSGVGRHLMSAGIRWAQEQGAEKLMVRTEADNVSAIGLYLNSGFRLQELILYVRKETAKEGDTINK